MAAPDNFLINVPTYQKAMLAELQNQCVALNVANMDFEDFQTRTAQLGDTITFQKPSRTVMSSGLVPNPTSAELLYQTLVCSQAGVCANSFNEKEFLFNAERYMDIFGRARVTEMGSNVDEDILANTTGTVRYRDPQNALNGQLVDPTSGPYRAFGDGTTPLNTYQQLAQAIADFRDFGSAKWDTKCILPSTYVPAFVGNGLTQFAVKRNDGIADDWMIDAEIDGCEFLRSNQLPIHMAGTAGDTNDILTLVSTNDPTGNNITQITVSSGTLGNDVNAIKVGDILTFQSPTLKFRKWTGHGISRQAVQIKAIADAASVAGTIVLDIYPALQSTPGNNQNLSRALIPGSDTLVALPSHQSGLLMSGRPLYVAMPRLSSMKPFDTFVATDDESGVSMRSYRFPLPQNNQYLFVNDILWGSTLIAENSLRLIFPLNS